MQQNAGFDTDAFRISTGPATILGVVTLLFACLPGGIIALMLANQAKAATATGNAVRARSKLRWSYAVSGVSLLFGLPLMILYIMSQ